MWAMDLDLPGVRDHEWNEFFDIDVWWFIYLIFFGLLICFIISLVILLWRCIVYTGSLSIRYGLKKPLVVVWHFIRRRVHRPDMSDDIRESQELIEKLTQTADLRRQAEKRSRQAEHCESVFVITDMEELSEK